MSQSLYTSITGLTTSQSRLDVIADNIANMNTTAFKASNMTFETLYTRTLSSGSGGTDTMGGTNPMQTGLGVGISSITRDFTAGTVQQTGRSTDLNIQGNGWFSIQTGDGQLGLTRDGNFSLDTSGNLVTSSGAKICGTDKTYSTSGSDDTIFIPEYLNLVTTGKDLTGAAGTLSNLNNANITAGTSTFEAKDATGVSITKLSVDLSGSNTLQDIATKINAAIAADTKLTDASGNSTLKAVVNTDGTFSLKLNSVTGLTDIGTMSINDVSGNFSVETGLSSAAKTGSEYKSDVLSYQVEISQAAKDADTYSRSEYSISSTGAISIKYSNGDTLETEAQDGKIVLKYTTSSQKTISSDDIKVKNDIVKASNLQIQLASVQNEQGLLLSGGNIYTTGPNSGEVTFSVGNSNGFGEIASGGLESSNVSMSIEFANMILAQRAVDANSRVFSATSEVLQALVRMS